MWRMIGASLVVCLLGTLSCVEAVTPGVGADRVLWKIPTWQATPDDPAFSNGIVYFYGATSRELLAVVGKSGQVRWRATVPGAVTIYGGTNVVVAGGTVAVGDVDVYGYDKETGRLLWRYMGEPGDEPGRGRILSDGSTIYLGSFRGRAQALDPATGQPKWTVDLTGGDSSVSAFNPFIAGNELYVGTKRFDLPVRGSLYALDARTGATRWKYDFTPEVANLFSGCFGDGVVIGDLVAVSQEDGRTFAFERATGRVRWIAPTVQTGYRASDARILAAAGQDVLAVSGTGTVSLLSGATGTTKWRTQVTLASVIMPPAIDAQYAYVSHLGVFAVYSLVDGSVRWTDPLVINSEASDFVSGAVSDGERLYVAGGTGYYALRKF